MPLPPLSFIYAVSTNGVIGVDGHLPWRLPDDFKHFKSTTMGCPIIMGRRTFEDHQAVLPGRTNIVLTRDRDWPAPQGITVAHSLEEALRPHAADERSESAGAPPETFIIGGATLFAQTFTHCTRIYETRVHTHIDPATDTTYLPALDTTDWPRTPLLDHPADARHPHPFTITRLDRPGREADS
jgi:dihydrofolate reductase